MNNKLALLISLIKINLSKNKLIVKVPYSKLNINILKILYNEGYIRGFKVTAKLIYIYLKINNNKPVFRDIIYFSQKNKNNYLSYKKLILFFGLKNFAIISTNMVY
jgi:small subunit ribosomal protein S8